MQTGMTSISQVREKAGGGGCAGSWGSSIQWGVMAGLREQRGDAKGDGAEKGPGAWGQMRGQDGGHGTGVKHGFEGPELYT